MSLPIEREDVDRIDSELKDQLALIFNMTHSREMNEKMAESVRRLMKIAAETSVVLKPTDETAGFSFIDNSRRSLRSCYVQLSIDVIAVRRVSDDKIKSISSVISQIPRLVTKAVTVLYYPTAVENVLKDVIVQLNTIISTVDEAAKELKEKVAAPVNLLSEILKEKSVQEHELNGKKLAAERVRIKCEHSVEASERMEVDNATFQDRNHAVLNGRWKMAIEQQQQEITAIQQMQTGAIEGGDASSPSTAIMNSLVSSTVSSAVQRVFSSGAESAPVTSNNYALMAAGVVPAAAQAVNMIVSHVMEQRQQDRALEAFKERIESCQQEKQSIMSEHERLHERRQADIRRSVDVQCSLALANIREHLLVSTEQQLVDATDVLTEILTDWGALMQFFNSTDSNIGPALVNTLKSFVGLLTTVLQPGGISDYERSTIPEEGLRVAGAALYISTILRSHIVQQQQQQTVAVPSSSGATQENIEEKVNRQLHALLDEWKRKLPK